MMIMRKHISGILFFVAGITIFMGIITGEIFYTSKYNTRNSLISTLASQAYLEKIVVQPSATIFNTIMVVGGLLILIGTYHLPSSMRAKRTLVLISLFGVGILGIGVFPRNMDPQHTIFAILAFVFGSLSTLVSAYMITSPLRYVFIGLGTVAMILFFFQGSFIPFLGLGGTERWIVYPLVFWLTGLGVHLLGQS